MKEQSHLQLHLVVKDPKSEANIVYKLTLINFQSHVTVIYRTRAIGGFQLLDLIIPELKSHVIPYKFKSKTLVENSFVKKSFTRFALQSECCNFNQ